MGDVEAITSARQSWTDAFNRADIEGMAAIVAEDCISKPPNEPPVVGREASRSWWQKGLDAATAHVEFSPQELEVAGDWAFDRFDFTMETTLTGASETVTDNGGCIWIWRRQPDDSWLMARAIWNSDNEATGVWTGAGR